LTRQHHIQSGKDCEVIEHGICEMSAVAYTPRMTTTFACIHAAMAALLLAAACAHLAAVKARRQLTPAHS
jgi:hypothetical protein